MQVEITTRCNFDCFYCAGRSMRQGDMSLGTFQAILERHIALYGVPNIVSLQGEGEPTLNKEIFEMAQLARDRGAQPYTITNGTYKHPERFIGLFSSLGVSVDTLDEKRARQIGRYNLKRVLAFVETLAPRLKIVIHTVYNRELSEAVVQWCRRQGYMHVVQPLQRKVDYTRNYPREISPANSNRKFACGYVSHNKLRYYTLDSVELPCAFIKDTSAYEGIEAMRTHLAGGTWPRCCAGCRYGDGRIFE